MTVQKIFVIGMNRTGTRTLCSFFRANGIPSVHWDRGRLARSMYRNLQRRKPLLDPEYEQNFRVFTDMEDVDGPDGPILMYRHFELLDKQYPGSKFILNTRPLNNWIRSRVQFQKGAYLEAYWRHEQKKKKGCKNKKAVLQMWKNHRTKHHKDVTEYFTKKRNRQNDLLIFDIEKDSPEKLCDFFNPFLSLNPIHYLHIGKTKQ